MADLHEQCTRGLEGHPDEISRMKNSYSKLVGYTNNPTSSITPHEDSMEMAQNPRSDYMVEQPNGIPLPKEKTKRVEARGGKLKK